MITCCPKAWTVLKDYARGTLVEDRGEPSSRILPSPPCALGNNGYPSAENAAKIVIRPEAQRKIPNVHSADVHSGRAHVSLNLKNFILLNSMHTTRRMLHTTSLK